METKEIRSFDCEFRADTNEEHGHFIVGRPIVFNSRTDLGWYDEIIDDGALNNTDLKDVRLLVNHNIDMIPLARSRNNTEGSTMKLTPVDGVGLDMRADLDIENNSDARALYSAVERGDLSGMSFMFVIDADSWDDIDSDHPVRHVRSIKRVLEVSAVTFPAYKETAISTRGLSDALESARMSLESVKAKRREIERRKAKIKILMEV